MPDRFGTDAPDVVVARIGAGDRTRSRASCLRRGAELDLTRARRRPNPLEADPTEVTVVAAITTSEKALPKVTSFGPAGKRRSTVAIVVLSIVTLGVYSLVWHHRINREVGNFDTRMHVIPGRSTVAVTIPWAIGWLVSIAGAVRIVLAVANVTLPFDPHFSRAAGVRAARRWPADPLPRTVAAVQRHRRR